MSSYPRTVISVWSLIADLQQSLRSEGTRGDWRDFTGLYSISDFDRLHQNGGVVREVAGQSLGVALRGLGDGVHEQVAADERALPRVADQRVRRLAAPARSLVRLPLPLR